MRTNVLNISKLLNMCYDFLQKYVHITTPEVYGATED